MVKNRAFLEDLNPQRWPWKSKEPAEFQRCRIWNVGSKSDFQKMWLHWASHTFLCLSKIFTFEKICIIEFTSSNKVLRLEVYFFRLYVFGNIYFKIVGWEEGREFFGFRSRDLSNTPKPKLSIQIFVSRKMKLFENVLFLTHVFRNFRKSNYLIWVAFILEYIFRPKNWLFLTTFGNIRNLSPYTLIWPRSFFFLVSNFKNNFE